MSRYRISADIGGTFTDLVFYDLDTKTYEEGKTLTTPHNLSDAIITCIDEKIDDYSQIEFFVHGTTSGLNAVLERRGARVALITTQGFRDVYQLTRGNREGMYDISYQRTKALVERCDTYEVAERILADGSVHSELDEKSLLAALAEIKQKGYESIAVCLINSYRNPAHEERVGELLRANCNLSVSLSCRVAREWREYERTSTTVLNAYIAPIVERYLTTLEEQMKARGYRGEIYIMQSGGGVISARLAKENPIQTLLSGPVGGAVGNRVLAETQTVKNLIGVDMGGTSYDVSMIIEGKPDVSNETKLEGFPILVPMINIYTIGAGGGSIAWIEGGGLRVGPVSAGSKPGPACYGKGGTKPTITDANLVLGRIDAEGFLGGKMQLDRQKAYEAVKSVADELNLDVLETAEGICRIADAKMADAIRQLTIRKGIDPREFTLVAFGGAGSMHACLTAAELDIKTVLVPKMPGIFSAWGMLQSDIRQDAVRTMKCQLQSLDVTELQRIVAEMTAEMETILAQQNIPGDKRIYQVIGDMRYLGQEYTIGIPFAAGGLNAAAIEAAAAEFHANHQRIYGHHNPAGKIEIVNLRLIGTGLLEKSDTAHFALDTNAKATPQKMTEAVFDGKSWPTAIYLRKDLPPGVRAQGPAIIEELTATTVVPPGFEIYVDEEKNLILTQGGDQ